MCSGFSSAHVFRKSWGQSPALLVSGAAWAEHLASTRRSSELGQRPVGRGGTKDRGCHDWCYHRNWPIRFFFWMPVQFNSAMDGLWTRRLLIRSHREIDLASPIGAKQNSNATAGRGRSRPCWAIEGQFLRTPQKRVRARITMKRPNPGMAGHRQRLYVDARPSPVMAVDSAILPITPQSNKKKRQTAEQGHKQKP